MNTSISLYRIPTYRKPTSHLVVNNYLIVYTPPTIMKSSDIIFEHVWQSSHEAVGSLSTLTTLRARTATSTSLLSHMPPLLNSRCSSMKNSKPKAESWTRLLGIGMVTLALGGLSGPLTPRVLLEAKYASMQVIQKLASQGDALRSYSQNDTNNTIQPTVFSPLKTPDGASIDPVNKEFSLVIPKIGVNAAVIPAVNPTKPGEYLAALQKGIAHSSLSYFPDEDGTVYLFSHSTNYEWFVGDLNAVFYLLKNLEEKDTVVLFYHGTAYTYRITGKQIVNPTAVSYMAPQKGARRLILQTCWPPGSTAERLLIFADLVEESNHKI